MDLDRAFVSSLLVGGQVAIRQMREKGLSPEFVFGDARKALDFVLDYYGRYHSLPDVHIIQGRTGVELEPIPDGTPPEFFLDQMIERKLFKRIQDGIAKVSANLEERDAIAAYKTLEEEIREIRKEQAVPSKVVNLLSLTPEVVALYERIKAGERGVLTPWSSVNDMTLGFWPQDLVLFVARLGVGKTWMTILIAGHAWVSGKRVLFATTEMGMVKIASRWLASHLKISYKNLRKGLLGAFEEQRMRDEVAKLSGLEGFYTVGGSFDFRPESFEAAIDECRPDIAVLDGAYLLRVKGANRLEAAANSFDELKRVAMRAKVPVVVTTQFNREGAKSKKGGGKVEHIAMTDVAGWNADLIFGLEQTDDMKRDRRMRINPIKFREGEGYPIDLRWDIDQMDFAEVPVPGSQAPVEDDPFSTGVAEGGAPAEEGKKPKPKKEDDRSESFNF